MRRKLFYIYFVLLLMVLTCTISTQTVSAKITHAQITSEVKDSQIADYCTYSYNSGTKTITLLPRNINTVQALHVILIAYICDKYPNAENLELLGFYGDFYGFSVPGDLTIDGLSRSGRNPRIINFAAYSSSPAVRAGGTITIKNASFNKNCDIYAGSLFIGASSENYGGIVINMRGHGDLVIRDTLTVKNASVLYVNNYTQRYYTPILSNVSLNNVCIEHCGLGSAQYFVPGETNNSINMTPLPIAGDLTLIDTVFSPPGFSNERVVLDVGGNITLERVAYAHHSASLSTILFNKGYNIQNISGTPRYIKMSSNDSGTTWDSGILKGIPNLSTSQPLNLSGLNYSGNLTCGGLTATNSQLGEINSSGPVNLTDTQAGNIVAGRGLTTNHCGVGTVTVNGDDSTKSSVIGTQLTGGTFNSVVTMDKITSTGTINFTVGARGSVIKNGTFSGAPAVNGTNFVEVVRGTFNDSGTKSSFLLADGSEASVTDSSTAGTSGMGTCSACGGRGKTWFEINEAGTGGWITCSGCAGTGMTPTSTPGKFGQVTTVKLSNPPVVIDWGSFPGINLDLDLAAPTISVSRKVYKRKQRPLHHDSYLSN